MTNLYRAFAAQFAARAADVLISVPGRGAAGPQRVTGAGIERAVESWAAALAAAGLRPGERIAVQVEKSLENVWLYLATLRLGAVYVPLNTAYQPAEIGYFLGDARPAVFVADAARCARLSAITEAAGVRTVLTLGASGDGDLPQRAAAERAACDAEPTRAPPIAVREPADLAALCYTSGTTGRSKGAMITHGNLLANARTLVAAWDFTAADVLLHALPTYHIHGLFVALHCAFLSGARLELLPRFEAAAVLAALDGATVMMGVPTFYTRLLDEPGLDTVRVRTVRLFISGSAPLLPGTFASFEARTGHRILERYGMTETQMITSNPLHGERRPGTVGVALPDVELRVADAEGQPLKRGEVGVIEVRSPAVCAGYWRMPEKTRAEIRPDGYFITGDLGVEEPDGYVRIVGRGKDLIISGGLNVYPREIEEAIDALPGVAESAVFGVPHPDFGEAVVAAVIARPGATLQPDVLVAALRERLAAFKTPKRLYLLPELPRNAMGKVQKASLRVQYGDVYRGPGV